MLDVDTDRVGGDNERLTHMDDVKEVRIGPSVHRVTKIGTSLTEKITSKSTNSLETSTY